MYEFAVCTSQRTQTISIGKACLVMMFKKIVLDTVNYIIFFFFYTDAQYVHLW
jgi:hypothetical protein